MSLGDMGIQKGRSNSSFFVTNVAKSQIETNTIRHHFHYVHDKYHLYEGHSYFVNRCIWQSVQHYCTNRPPSSIK